MKVTPGGRCRSVPASVNVGVPGVDGRQINQNREVRKAGRLQLGRRAAQFHAHLIHRIRPD